MALFPKTPGVYIEEIPRFPSSVAAVPTSVPVFIGYTEKADIGGVAATSFPTSPVRIESLLQYQTIFGGPLSEAFNVVLSGPSVDITASLVVNAGKDFRLYYNLLMYFANGGGPCYIISVGKYSTSTITDASLLIGGIPKAEQVDEITMVLAPDAMSAAISNIERRDLYNAMLAHCAKLQDRFALLDVLNNTAQSIQMDADQFRNDAVGANNLSFGAAYYPSFRPGFPFTYADSAVGVNATAVNLPTNIQTFGSTNLSVINNGTVSSITISYVGPAFTIPTDTLTVDGVSIGNGTYSGAGAIRAAINSNPLLNGKFVATDNVNDVTITSLTPGVPAAIVVAGTTVGTEITLGLSANGLTPDKVLYNRIKEQVNEIAIELYPSAMMSGIYCAVDSTRGVWKAPANVGITLVNSLNRAIKDSDQENLNVDATSGKSIDALRVFPGRGALVWGARTLDGNSNEWRYISVRRTFLFIEDSCKQATMFSVFEPNDMNTWLRIKGMISSFLTTIWRDGGLAGSKPDQAFFVKVGLGETMTAQDILEGRLIVQIGLAVVRPAEFIILQFEHKLQVS